jgi:hypothetical protein
MAAQHSMRLPALLIVVLLWAMPAMASPITYAFTGTLGDCGPPEIAGCVNDWSGKSIFGSITMDTETHRFQEYAFLFDPSPWTWIAPAFPDVSATDGRRTDARLTISGENIGMTFVEVYDAMNSGPCCVTDPERNTVRLGFIGLIGGPLAFSSGNVERIFAGPHLGNPIVSGTALVSTPEPSTWVLLATGLLCVGWRARRRIIGVVGASS